jgi:hypothetical protein
MKIDPAKNHPAEKKESKSVFKTAESVFNSANPLKTAQSVPAPSTSAFAKILEENRRQTGKDDSPAAKMDSADTDSKTTRAEKEEKTGRQSEAKTSLKERGGKHGDGGADQNGDENQPPVVAPAALQVRKNSVTETAAPAARAILHIADLERIVSSVRTDTFQNQKQITIALKNSVLQGLQIKLTIAENGRIKAEFLALDEQIKKQLSRRKNELSEILKNRSALFSEVEIKSQNPGAKE